MYEEILFTDIRSTMSPGDLFFDIGAYDGQTSVLVGERVGYENVVIIEPSEVNWANIRERYRETPRASFPGFLSSDDKPASILDVVMHGWPEEAEHMLMPEEKLEFRWLHYRGTSDICGERPWIKLDTLVKRTGAPKGFVMDVEGAELKVLQGAAHTLISHPFVWVAIHPRFMEERFGDNADALHELMAKAGYREKLLWSGHEEHWRFEP